MSTLSVACPYCQKQIKVPEKMIGREIRCPGCKQGLKLEGAGGPPPADGAGQGGADFGNLSQGAGQTRRPSAFWELLTFRRMIAPFVLQLVFWLSVLGWIGFGGLTIVTGVMAMAASASVKTDAGKADAFPKGDFGPGNGFPMPSGAGSGGMLGGGFLILLGLAQMIFGPLVTRVYFEMLIMVFRVYDVLREVRDKLDRR